MSMKVSTESIVSMVLQSLQREKEQQWWKGRREDSDKSDAFWSKSCQSSAASPLTHDGDLRRNWLWNRFCSLTPARPTCCRQTVQKYYCYNNCRVIWGIDELDKGVGKSMNINKIISDVFSIQCKPYIVKKNLRKQCSCNTKHQIQRKYWNDCRMSLLRVCSNLNIINQVAA